MVVVLLRLILSPNVAPLSVEALNNTSELLLGMFLSVVHTIYILSPHIAIGALVLKSGFGSIKEYAECWSCNTPGPIMNTNTVNVTAITLTVKYLYFMPLHRLGIYNLITTAALIHTLYS
jgi:hypothetical protein